MPFVKIFCQSIVGIELVNSGRLEKHGDRYLTWFGKEVPAEEVFIEYLENGQERYWHKYTDDQLTRLTQVSELLVKEFDIKHIVGHLEITSGRKTDPGPAFPPMKEFQARVFQKGEV